MAKKKTGASPSPADRKKVATKQQPKSKSTRRTKADKIKLAEEICTLYETGDYTLESCCEEHGISYGGFVTWRETIKEISDRFKEAKDKSSKALKIERTKKAADGLEKLITGYWIEETEETILTDKNDSIINKRVNKRKRWVEPKAAAVIFALKALQPEVWNTDKMPEVPTETQVFVIGDQVIRF